MGDWVRGPTPEEEPLITLLFDLYVGDLDLKTKFSVPDFMGDEALKELGVIGGVAETSSDSYCHLTRLKVGQRPRLPANVSVQVPPGMPVPLGPWAVREFDYGIQSLGWVENKEGK
jgi:hypothetical protein